MYYSQPLRNPLDLITILVTGSDGRPSPSGLACVARTALWDPSRAEKCCCHHAWRESLSIHGRRHNNIHVRNTFDKEHPCRSHNNIRVLNTFDKEHPCRSHNNIRVFNTLTCSVALPLGKWTLLSTQRLRKEPGLKTVLRALALYRQARVREISHGPKDFCNPDTDNAWLKL